MIRRVEDRAYATICRHVTDACYTAPFLLPGFFPSVQDSTFDGTWHRKPGSGHRTASHFQHRIGWHRAV